MKREDLERIHPVWNRRNLEKHFRKHGKEVAFALEQPTAGFGQGEYEQASLRSVHKAMIYFEAQRPQRNNGENGELIEPRCYFVDSRLLQAITDISTSRFISYHQLSFDGTVSQSTIKGMTEGDRLLKFQTKIKHGEDGGMLVQVRRKYGFPPVTT